MRQCTSKEELCVDITAPNTQQLAPHCYTQSFHKQGIRRTIACVIGFTQEVTTSFKKRTSKPY